MFRQDGSQPAKDLELSATSVRVGSKSEAEELFLCLYQGESEVRAAETRPISSMLHRRVLLAKSRTFLGGKEGSYHWDTSAGHGSLNPHSELPHLQIHTYSRETVHIFMDRNRVHDYDLYSKNAQRF